MKIVNKITAVESPFEELGIAERWPYYTSTAVQFTQPLGCFIEFEQYLVLVYLEFPYQSLYSMDCLSLTTKFSHKVLSRKSTFKI